MSKDVICRGKVGSDKGDPGYKETAKVSPLLCLCGWLVVCFLVCLVGYLVVCVFVFVCMFACLLVCCFICAFTRLLTSFFVLFVRSVGRSFVH